MSSRSKLLTVILVVLTAGVVLASVLVAYQILTRLPGTDSTSAGESDRSFTTEPGIAYVTYDSEESEISALYVSDPDGSNPHLVAESSDGRCLYPSWSPDGQSIAYLIHTPGEDGELWNGNDLFEVWVAPLDGSEQIRISDAIPNIHEAHPVSWSPDGTRLAFLGEVEEDTTDTLFVVRADGSGVEYRIPLDFWAIEMMLWSPTGEELLFMPETDTTRMTVYLLSLEDMQIIPLYEVGMLDSWGWGVPLDWSPTGTEFAVASPLAQEVLIMSTDGVPRHAARIPSGFPVEIAWSPSGEHIAVTVSSEFLDAGDVSDMTLHILEVETGELVAVFYEEERMMTLPNWSSDGNCLVFTTLYEHPEGWLDVDSLWMYDLTSGELEQLVTGWGTIR